MTQTQQPVKQPGETEDEFNRRKGRWEAEQLEARKDAADDHEASDPLEKFRNLWG